MSLSLEYQSPEVDAVRKRIWVNSLHPEHHTEGMNAKLSS